MIREAWDQVRRLAQLAVEAWGRDEQMRQAQEECAELVSALNQHRRGRISADDLADEVADVAIMLAQLAILLGEERCLSAVRRKAAKLQRHLDGAATLPPQDPGVPADDLSTAIAGLGREEVAVLVYIARRLADGQRTYGALDLARDGRDFVAERAAELADAVVYTAMAELRRAILASAVHPGDAG